MIDEVFEFLVLGSKGDEYEISIEVTRDTVSSFCSCPAGTFKGICKHVLGILGGDGSSLKDQSDCENLRKLSQTIASHPVGEYVREWNEANKIIREAEKRVDSAKNLIRDYLKPKR